MNFKDALQNYLSGQIAFDQLRSLLALEIEASPESVALCLELLNAERDKGWLAPKVYADLHEIITRDPASAGGNDTESSMPSDSSIEGIGTPPGESPPTVLYGTESSQVYNENETLLHPEAARATQSTQAIQPGQTRPPTVAPPTGSTQAGKLDVGSILGGQFVLEEQLGRGGMGVVYKALDIKAKAANDRNPYVAIKVLSEEFKQHPDSLIQMQREAKKAQSLAHPNIVNVFIFNFDENYAWIAMEYLEGYPLDEVKGKRLPRNKALSYIEQMTSALQHAHSMKPHPIVHYDLKPANLFLTQDGIIKLLDFGIARAAPVGRVVPKDQTVFDPGALGAMTPSYASCEMIRGMDPDPRDDVYGMACVAYFLLTGEHPFDRCPANEAQAARMTLPRHPDLSRRQYKALAHGLEFTRSKRTRSAAQFLRELKPPEKRTSAKALLAATVVLVIAIGASAPLWFPAAQKDWQVFQTSRSLPTQTEAELVQSIDLIKTLSVKDTQRIFSKQANTDRLVDYYRQRIDTVFNPDQNTYGYADGLVEMRRLQNILPDSPTVKKLETDLEQRRTEALQRQRDLAGIAVRDELLVPGDGDGHLPSVLSVIRKLDPYDALQADVRIAAQYSTAVETALLRENFERAELLVETGRGLVTDETARMQLRAAESRIEQTRTGVVTSPLANIGTGMLSNFNTALTTQDFERAEQLLAGFEESGLSAELGREATDRLAAAYLAEAQTQAADGDLPNARALIASGLALEPGDNIEQALRALDSEAQERELTATNDQRKRRRAAITGVRADLNQRLSAENFGIADVGWAVDALTRLDQLGADTRDDRQQVVGRIVVAGDTLIAAGDPNEAYNLGKYADAFFQGSSGINGLNERVAAAIGDTQQEPTGTVLVAPEPGSVDDLLQGLDALLQVETLTEPSSAARIRAQMRRLERSGTDIGGARNRVANAAIDRANQFSATGQPDLARSHLELAREYGIDVDPLPDTRTVSNEPGNASPGADTDADTRWRAFELAIAAGNPEAGTAEYERLKAVLPASDSYLQNEAPGKLVNAYIDAALGAARGRDYDTALTHLDRALRLVPDDARTIRYQDRFTRLRDAL